MTRLRGLLLALVVALGLALGVGPGVAESAQTAQQTPLSQAKRTVPTRDQWLADVKAAMKGSRGYVRQRVAAKSTDEKLAINFDIDNTVLATYYGGGAIPLMLRFSKLLTRLDVAMVFNSGRPASQQQLTTNQLTKAGFPVTEVCLRSSGEKLVAGKQRCRNQFIDEGYTLIANIGNNDTDFVGTGYERAYHLPNYGVLG